MLTGEHAGATTYALTFACDFDQYCQDGLWLDDSKPLLPCKNEASCARLEAELAPLVALARGEPVRQFARDTLLQAGPVADRSAARARLGLVNTLVAGSIGGEGEISSTGSLHLTDDLRLTLISYVCANPTGDHAAAMEACRSRKPYPDRQVFVLPAVELARIVVDSPSVEQPGRDVVLLCNDDAPCFALPATTMRRASATDAFIVNCLGVDDCAAIARGLRDIAAFVASTSDGEGAPSDEVQSLAADTSPSETPVEVISAEEAEELYGISKQDFVPQIDYPDELKPLAARAEQGDADAQFQLGMQHLNGIGLPHYIHAESPGGAGTRYEISRNYFAAARWLGAAANQNHAEAQYELAGLYMTGEGVRPSPKEALRWFRAAEKQDFEDAIGVANFLEDVREGDPTWNEPLLHAMWLYEDDHTAAALAEFVALAENGDVLAAFYAGHINQWGYQEAPVGTDFAAEAIKWFRKAAEAGNAWAQQGLGDVHTFRCRGADDLAEAEFWYAAAAEQGSPEAMGDPAYWGCASRAGVPIQAAELEACGRIVGQWQWQTGDIPGVLTFGANNEVSASVNASSSPVLRGTWTCDAATATFVITWPNGVVENLAMHADGSAISGRNNFGSPVTGSPLAPAMRPPDTTPAP